MFILPSLSPLDSGPCVPQVLTLEWAWECNRLKLKNFAKFESAASALEEVTAIVENKVSPMLASLLEGVKDEKKASLIVSEPKLGMGCIRILTESDLV